MEPRDRFRRFVRLARGKLRRQSRVFRKRFAAINKQLNTGRVISGAEARVIGRAFVAKVDAGWERRMMGEQIFIWKIRVQDCAGCFSLQLTVEVIGYALV